MLNTFNKHITTSFFNFFLLLLLLNPFLLIDPELFIFFSIALIVLLFANDLSDSLVNVFNVRLIQYYYFYVRFFNIQLIFLSELSKFLNLYVFTFNIPYFIKWYQSYSNNLSVFFELNFNRFNSLLNLNFLSFLRKFKVFLLHFYINYYFLMRKAWRYLFIKKRWSNYRIMSDYVIKHLSLTKVSAEERSNVNLIRSNFSNLIKVLKLKI